MDEVDVSVDDVEVSVGEVEVSVDKVEDSVEELDEEVIEVLKLSLVETVGVTYEVETLYYSKPREK